MRIESKAQLARWAGVSRQAMTRACKEGGPLHGATTPQGVDVEHPIALAWLNNHGVRELPAPPPPKPAPARPKPAKPPNPPPEVSQTPTLQPPPDVPLDEFETLTLREIVMRFGTIDGLKRYVDSLKTIAS
jgi:hypothetical protein